MGKIHVLDQHTINQIAAGEVIERPMSVVKELLDNAIDAHATAITVEIKDGGLSLIRITDNGSGIAPEDIKNAFLPHATSKINDAADLVSISSLGFRGEALASIASVCRVELITKTTGEITGTSYKIEGGKEIELCEIGAPDGTTFIVRDIFFNTPARRKFLKSAQTEGVYISELVERIALSKPDISFRLIMNGQTKLFTTGNGKLKDVIYAVFGREISQNIIPVKHKLTSLSITGFAGKPVINRGNRSFEIFFINGRYVKCKMVYKAIEEAYKPFMMTHKYPFCVLNIEIAPVLLDVNVHPAKMELRFRQEEVLYKELVMTINSAVSNRELVVDVVPAKDKAPVNPARRDLIVMEDITFNKGVKVEKQLTEPFETKRMTTNPFIPVKPPVEPLKSEFDIPDTVTLKPGLKMPEIFKTDDGPQKLVSSQFEKTDDVSEPVKPVAELVNKAEEETNSEETSKPAEAVRSTPVRETVTDVSQMELFDDRFLSKKARSSHRVVGQLFNTYWIVEFGDKMYMIDQHAAHEKVIFERIMAGMRNREATSQMISPSIMLHLTDRQANTLESNLAFFRQLGFEIEDFGGGSYSVSALPANLFKLNQMDLLIELIDDLSDNLKGSNNQTIIHKVATMSCKAAVKGGMKLTFEEANKLIDELLTLDNPYACPHGRPTIISMSRTEIEKKFKRIV
ncbi:MAG: DNA mismatch repair endonuclease MutL [Lachnospiraceae bacterium]|nr:DNA mismatch repair endonuclease MutL [Lachnospiraceae bacterium]